MLPWDLIAQSQIQGPMLWVDRVARAPISQVLIFSLIWTVVRIALHPYLMKVKPHQKTGFYGLAKILNELSDAIVYAAIVVFLLVRPFGIQTFYIPTGSMINTLLLNDYIVANKFVYRFWEPKPGDIVVFQPPAEAQGGTTIEGQESLGAGGVDYIKRLIGGPGDVVEVRDRVLYRNGKAVDEPYVVFTTTTMSGKLEVAPKEEWQNYSYPDFKLVNDNGKYIPVTMMGDDVNSPGMGTAPAFRVDFDDAARMVRLKNLPPAAIPPGQYLFMGDNRNGSFDGRFWGLAPREAIVGRSEFIFIPFSRWRATR